MSSPPKSRREPLPLPRAGPAREPDPVVKAILAPLPKLHGLGDEAVASPVGRPRDPRALEAPACFAVAALQRLSPGDHLALARSPCAKATLAAAGLEILVRLSRADLLHPPLDANLAAELVPPEDRGGVRAFRELPALPALVIGVEDESAPIQALEKDHAGGWPPAPRRGSEGHRGGL